MYKKDICRGRKGTWRGVWDFGPLKCVGKAASMGLCREFPEVAVAENGKIGPLFPEAELPRRKFPLYFNNI